MAQLRANAHRVLNIGGHEFVGFADEDRPIEYGEGEDLFELQSGPDGGLYGSDSGKLMRTLTVRLAPTSPSVQWLIEMNEMRKNTIREGDGEIPIFNGTDEDTVVGISAELKQGVLSSCPDMPEPGQTFEAMFTFEDIVSSVDGGTFTAPLEEGPGTS